MTKPPPGIDLEQYIDAAGAAGDFVGVAVGRIARGEPYAAVLAAMAGFLNPTDLEQLAGIETPAAALAEIEAAR